MKVLFKGLAWVLVELLVFAALFVASGALIVTGIQWISGNEYLFWTSADLNEQTSPYTLLTSTFIPVLLSGTLAAGIAHHSIFKRPLSGLGFGYERSFFYFGQGWLWSFALVLPGFLILWFLGQIHLLPADWNGYYFAGFILFFIIQSAGEEVMTRAYLIPMIEARFNTLAALVVSASIFALMHLGNEHFTWIGFLNILAGGTLMALFFIRYRNIWVCTGLHAGWNFVQASLLDFNVSGIDVYSFIQFQDTGYPGLSGGDFGYEGSWIAWLIQVAGIYLFYRWNRAELSVRFNRQPAPLTETTDAAKLWMPMQEENPGE
ncbi:MAG TPA: CPBP family intramembrane metalloprotease [Saprospiraceae bacterium]|nr:CPBP family intramembrane metalloprotease [Saprospiraceae bacterium]HNT19090.1 CPBP family intramembrane metalloprotease [Saprospiraceae bacterium]